VQSELADLPAAARVQLAHAGNVQTHVGLLCIFIMLCAIAERVTFKLAADALAFQP